MSITLELKGVGGWQEFFLPKIDAITYKKIRKEYWRQFLQGDAFVRAHGNRDHAWRVCRAIGFDPDSLQSFDKIILGQSIIIHPRHIRRIKDYHPEEK